MSSLDTSRHKLGRLMTSTQKREYQLLQRSLSRLQQRSMLYALAQEMLVGVHKSEDVYPAYVGELDPLNICHDPRVKYDCHSGKAFDCKDKFDCDSTAKIKAYDCDDFNCGDPGSGTGSFNCDAAIDFLCGGPDYDCIDSFECSAGHVFLCSEDHDCEDTFACKTTGKNSPEDPDVDCPEHYTVPGGGGTAGDFLCGIVAQSPTTDDSFDCLKDFTCGAKDDFVCQNSTSFQCGDGEKDKFTCAAEDRFDCIDEFECYRYGGEYECADGTAGYNPPPPG